MRAHLGAGRVPHDQEGVWPGPRAGRTDAFAEACDLRDHVRAAAARAIELAEVLLQEARPRWRFHALAEGGHMAPLLRPDLVNPVVAAFLDAQPRSS